MIQSTVGFTNPQDIGSSSVAIPAGGDTGQILAKETATDYDFIWIDNNASPTNSSDSDQFIIANQVFG